MPEASGSDLTDELDYSIFENKTGLAEDMKFLASMPELCDVTFLVGDTREPICAVKAVLASRSRVFQKMFYQAPSPQRKKEPPPRENKLRVFLKRSSEPLLNLQNAAQQPNQHQTVIIEEFEPDVFRQLIEYIHTGCVTLQPRTLLGLMNAADYYGLDQLRKACTGFVQCCITVDTVCALLASAERYIQYKCTKSLVQKVLEFVDEHGNEVLNLGSFTLLPQHVVRLILAREELRADEFTKFQAALMWSKKYCDSNQNQSLKDVIGNFLEYIQFHKIPANVLMKEVHPLGLVPSGTIVNALAYQADPTSVDPGKLSPHRVKHHDRSLSVQSSLQDPCGSNTSLSSTGSDEGSDDKQHSGKYGIAEQESREESREEQQWQQKQRDEEDDLQRLIEQRSQFQQMRQEEEVQRQQEEQQVRRQEEELRKQEMQEEFDKRQKKREEEEASKKQQQEDDTQKQREEDELKKQQEKEERKRQEDELRKQEEEELERKETEEELNRQNEVLKQQMLDEQVQMQMEQDEEITRQQKSEESIKKPEEEQEQQMAEGKEELQELQETKLSEDDYRQAEKEPPTLKMEEESNEQPEQEEQWQIAQELQDRQKEEEQRRFREERKMQLQLEELKTQWTEQQELMLQKQEEILQRDIRERKYAEQLDEPQFQQLQLHLEGRKPEEIPGLRETVERRESIKRTDDRVEIRVRETELQRQDQQLPQEAPAEGVAGLYIRIVVKREGRANLVWLFKTHKF